MSKAYEITYTITGTVTIPEDVYDIEMELGEDTSVQDRIDFVKEVEAESGFEGILEDVSNGKVTLEVKEVTT